MTALRRLFVTPWAAVPVGLAGLLAGLLATALDHSGVGWFFALLPVALAVVVADSRLAQDPMLLGLRREAPATTTVDLATTVALQVRNLDDRGVLVHLHDAAPLSARREPREHRAWLPPRSAATLHSTLTPARRGDLELGPVTVRTHGPLRLAGRQAAVPVPATLRVHPRLPGRAEVELRLGKVALVPGLRRTRVLGNGTEFDHLRDHHPDDDFRRINAMATARAGRPIATVLREEKNQRVVLLVDASRAMAPRVAGVPRLEWAIDAAVAVAEIAGRMGDHVGAAAFDRRIRARVAPRTGRRQGQRVLDALYGVEPSLDAAAHRAAFGSVLSEHRRRSLLVLLTDLPDDGAIDSLLAAMPALVRRHVVIVGSIRDPQLSRTLHVDPTTSQEVHLAASAATAVADRRGAARRLQALGARVVDESPDRFAGALVDAYLDLKATGRL